MQRVERVIEIDAPVERVFDLFSDFENFPRWMRHIRDVHYTGRRYTRWTADAPLGTSVEWEAETMRFEPPHAIAWRSVRGDVDTEGEVTFRETRRGTTIMRVVMGYEPPAGRLGAFVASIFGADPERQLDEDLDRFAEVAERRPRRARHADHPRPPQPPRESFERRGRNFYNEDAPPGAGRRDYREDRREDEARRERERRTRVEAAMREAQRMQLDDRRRYEEERERSVRRMRSEGRDTGRLNFDEEWDERLGEPLPRERRDERRGRHALTPRERERELRERTPDYDYSREAFRRGIDKLMDEPPSRRWRRWD